MLNERRLEADNTLADGERNDSAVVIGPTLSSSSPLCTVPYIGTDQGYVFEGGGMSTLQQLGAAGYGNTDCIGGGGDLGFSVSIEGSGTGLGGEIRLGGISTGEAVGGIAGMGGGGGKGGGGGGGSGRNMNKEVRYAPLDRKSVV